MKINVFPLTTWSKVWVNRLYVTVCAFIHLDWVPYCIIGSGQFCSENSCSTDTLVVSMCI